MRMIETRGKRNNNPFNIIKNPSNAWLGKIPSDLSNDGRFEQFLDMKYGIRAGLILLRRYITIYRLDSVSEIIKRFAPESENNTKAYITFVESRMRSLGFTSDSVEFGTPKFCAMCSSILIFESDFHCDEPYLMDIIHVFGL